MNSQDESEIASGKDSGKKTQRLLVIGVPLLCLLLGLYALGSLSQHRSVTVLQSFDTLNLEQFLTSLNNAATLTVESFPIATVGNSELINTELLGLRKERLAYLAKSNDEVVAIIAPATAEDGFNGFVDLLVAVDMTGHILAARVIRDLQSSQLHGTVDVIESQWMKEFDGNAMRDIRRISWQTIQPENEYDQFVGASVTPKTVSDRLYDTLVFVQSNRIALMRGGG